MKREPITRTLDPDIWKRFMQLSGETRIPSTRLLDEAMEDLLKKYGRDVK